jgi:thiamine pyrophosphate-dependent acetolactate synthase large subunit-like protein
MNGQSQSDDILIDVRRHWAGMAAEDGGARLRARPGTILGHANAVLRPLGRRLGPDPASADMATIGGVIANNAESTSTMAQQIEWLPTTRTGSFFATASGGIGWGVAAAVGVALGDRDRGVRRPVVGLIGDGSFQYSVQALWTAAQHNLPAVYVVMRNSEYSILKSFAVLKETPGVPGLDLPGLGIAELARGFGCRGVDVGTAEELEREFKAALSAQTTTVIVVSTQPRRRCCSRRV